MDFECSRKAEHGDSFEPLIMDKSGDVVTPRTRELTEHLSDALEELERLESQLEQTENEAIMERQRADRLQAKLDDRQDAGPVARGNREEDGKLREMETRLEEALSTIAHQEGRIHNLEQKNIKLRKELDAAVRRSNDASPYSKTGMRKLHKNAVHVQRVWRGKRQRKAFWNRIEKLCELVETPRTGSYEDTEA